MLVTVKIAEFVKYQSYVESNNLWSVKSTKIEKFVNFHIYMISRYRNWEIHYKGPSLYIDARGRG